MQKYILSRPVTATAAAIGGSSAQTQAWRNEGKNGQKVLQQGGSQAQVRLFHLESGTGALPSTGAWAPGTHRQHMLTLESNRQLELIKHEWNHSRSHSWYLSSPLATEAIKSTLKRSQEKVLKNLKGIRKCFEEEECFKRRLNKNCWVMDNPVGRMYRSNAGCKQMCL